MPVRTFLLATALVASSCAADPRIGVSPTPEPVANETRSVGVLVMAHGGSPEWNAHVGEAVAPLASEVPTALAYGMANPMTLRASLDSLDARGVDHVAVVRLFLSGESFLDQTEFYLGLSEEPPAEFLLMGPMATDATARVPIPHPLAVATHHHGLLDSPEAAEIATKRAMTLSQDPARERVLMIAHGMGEEHENQRVLRAMGGAQQSISSLGFAAVEIETLREDWPEHRAVAEVRIREFVTSAARDEESVLVIPMRLSGFGPYAEVLEGLEYRAGDGLLPDDAIATWVRRTANEVSCGAGWGPLVDTCPRIVADPAVERR